MANKYLSIYLNDHLALMIGTSELVKRSLDSNKETEFGRFLETVLESNSEERRALETLMEREQVSQNRTKTAGAWVAERVGRLKMNGELTGYSDLSRLVEIEGMGVALEAKRMFWDTLHGIGFTEARGMQTRSIARRAEQQMEQLNTHRAEAAESALGMVGSGRK
ncbi:MAG TPA: hypothetical protein VM754_13215 [Actinomycetota bacterium]|jgi:hypothetical protein|nr:hypothetical protein [Actinomycetota bacterium]